MKYEIKQDKQWYKMYCENGEVKRLGIIRSNNDFNIFKNSDRNQIFNKIFVGSSAMNKSLLIILKKEHNTKFIKGTYKDGTDVHTYLIPIDVYFKSGEDWTNAKYPGDKQLILTKDIIDNYEV